MTNDIQAWPVTEKEKITLIDADNFKYIFGWHHKDADVADPNAVAAVKRDVNIRIKELLTLARTRKYIGIFGSTPEWRIRVYRYKLYKGNRGEKPEFVQKWGPIIEQHCKDEWGFLTMPKWEADDLIGWIARDPELTSMYDFITCSPDKDLDQIPGRHLSWQLKKDADGIESNLYTISVYQAAKNFWTQMLTGDNTDNVAGIPGIGPAKVKAIFAEVGDDPFEMEIAVMSAYQKYFGEFYGNMIFNETKCALFAGPKEMHTTIHLDMESPILGYVNEMKEDLDQQWPAEFEEPPFPST